MKTLIIAGGEISQKEIAKYCEEYSRTKYNCCG